MKPSISVVIPTYNEEKYIERCLKSLLNQTIPRKNYEIIVVDGQSTDKTVKLAKKFADKVIQQKSEGVGGARNDGVKIAKCDIVATTDADCIVPKNWLEDILMAFKRDKNLVAVYGVDNPIEKTLKSKLTYKFIRIIFKFGAIFNFHTLIGTNSSFRKDVFQKIGGYNNLPYLDDTEISFRIKKEGKIKCLKSLCVQTSNRRLEKNGYLSTLLIWSKGAIQLLLGLPLSNIKYNKQNY